MDVDLQPISWWWLKPVLISSFLILSITSGVMIPLSKLIEPHKLARIPNWLRWALVLPFAFIMGLICEMVPRMLFSLMEVVINAHLTYRPGFDELVWQLWAPLFFVAGGVQMAPAYKFPTFLVVGGLKIAAAGWNLVQIFYFISKGGPWSALDPITHSPLWWNTFIYVLCLAVLVIFGFFLARDDKHWRKVALQSGVLALAFVAGIVAVRWNHGGPSERFAKVNPNDPKIMPVHTVRLHNLEKAQLRGSAFLLSGWTLDDELNVVMLYGDTDKPCTLDISKEAVAAQYEVIGDKGKHTFVWEVQPNDHDAGCVLEFARIGKGGDQEDPQQK